MIERIRKRAFYPLKLVNGETIHLRGLSGKQLETVKPFMQDDASVGYVVGVAVLNDDGTNAFTQLKSESPVEFGQRVLSEIELASDVQKQLIDKIFMITNEPDKVQHEAIVKNS